MTRIGADSSQKYLMFALSFSSPSNYSTPLLYAHRKPLRFVERRMDSNSRQKGQEKCRNPLSCQVHDERKGKGVPVQAFRRAGVQETEENVETKKIGEALSRHSR